jgi:N-acetylneuraminate synthase
MKNTVSFIAEISSNHSSDLKRCFEFIDKAAEIGCDAVKFQLFKIDKLFAPEILERSKKHRDRRAWELPVEFIPKLYTRCVERNIKFSCTPFYIEAVQELENYVDFFKVASYELLWDDLLAACAKTGKPVIISTGMATISEILHAVEVLRNNDCHDITILHCTSSYPTPFYEANLKAIQTIFKATGCKVGWSDHTVEPGVIYRAVHAYGASEVEFHLDLDGNGEEYATGHCWLPNEIAPVIRDVRIAMESDGTGIKEPVSSELGDRMWRADPSDGLRPFKSIRENYLSN